MDMDSPDLQTKYQKLASEYSKLKAQNQVLKRAVIDEQGRITSLKDNLKTQDQSLRKKEQELDSLSFRNQQLTKRLSLLQDDVEAAKAKSRKGNCKREESVISSDVDHSVFLEELESKIKENSRLHAEISDLELFYKAKVSELESLLFDRSKETQKLTEDDRAKVDSLQSQIQKLENDLSKQGISMQQKENRIKVLEEYLYTMKASPPNGSLDSHACESVGTPQDSLSSLNKNYDELDSILTQQDNTECLTKNIDGRLLKKFSNCVTGLSSGFVNFFRSYVSILKHSNSTAQITNQSKFVDLVSGEIDSWSLLSKRFDEISSNFSEDETVHIENLSGFGAFSKVLSTTASSLRKLLPILSENYDGEGLDNAHWRSTLGRLVSSWSALIPYIASLAAYREGKTPLNVFAVKKILNLLHGRIVKLQLISKDLLTTWEKTVSGSDKNVAVVQQALATIEHSFSQICFLFSDVVYSCGNAACASDSPSSTSTASAGTPNLAICYGAPPIGLHNSIECPSSLQDSLSQTTINNEETSLVQQLAEAMNRLSTLEEEREHWRLEYELLSHRFDKEIKKSVESGKNPSEFESDSLISASETIEQSLVLSTSSIAEVVVNNSENREKEIRDYFTKNCSNLQSQLTYVTSQATLYQDECEVLVRRLGIADERRLRTEQETDRLRKEILETKETLATTSRNYEEQISTMSEYLADLNDKISKQADQIEELKFELKRKGKK